MGEVYRARDARGRNQSGRNVAATPVTVLTPAGESLKLRWDTSVYLTGPAEIVGAGEFYWNGIA